MQTSTIPAAGATADLVFRITIAVSGATCVVAALAGLKHVIVDTQPAILQGDINADILRFIAQHLNRALIASTSIFIGAFTEILVGSAPIIWSSWKRSLYWKDADIKFLCFKNIAKLTQSNNQALVK